MMRKDTVYYVAGVLVIAASIILVVTGKAPSYAPPASGASRSAVRTERDPLTVVDVYDGDTVTLADGRHIRYLGINTTEIGETLSEEARERNKELTLGKVVRLELDEVKTDSYGRTLAFVWVGRTNVNLSLIREGLAHMMFIPPNVKHYDEFLEAQKEAQAKKRGLWGLEEFQTPVRITSFHPDRGYLRMVNITCGLLGLAGWSAQNDRGDVFRFPAMALKPGYSLVLNFGEGQDTQNPERDPEKQITLYWGLKDKVWDWQSPSVRILDASGKQVAFKSAPD
jgi:endonuclease YncB( thermonuclease family)